MSFEVVYQAWTDYAHDTGSPSPVGAIDADAVRRLIADWFCPVMGHPGAAAALVERGLGIPIAEADALPGDLCQFWRRTNLDNPSGHSVVFKAWSLEGGQRHIHYWSSQRSTNGVGVHAEVVGPQWTLHFARALVE